MPVSSRTTAPPITGVSVPASALASLFLLNTQSRVMKKGFGVSSVSLGPVSSTPSPCVTATPAGPFRICQYVSSGLAHSVRSWAAALLLLRGANYPGIPFLLEGTCPSLEFGLLEPLSESHEKSYDCRHYLAFEKMTPPPSVSQAEAEADVVLFTGLPLSSRAVMRNP